MQTSTSAVFDQADTEATTATTTATTTVTAVQQMSALVNLQWRQAHEQNGSHQRAVRAVPA